MGKGCGVENRFAVVKIFVEVKNEVFRQRQRPSSAPADCFFDLPRLGAIFGSEIVYGFAGIEPGSDDRSRDAGTRDYRLAKTHRRIDLDQLGLILRSLHDEWVEREETSGIAMRSGFFFAEQPS